MSSRWEQKEQARGLRLQREAEHRARRRRKRRRLGLTATVTVLALLAGAVAVAATRGTNPGDSVAALPSGGLAPLASLGKLRPPGSPGPAGPEGVPTPDAPPLAAPELTGTGSPVNGIQCQGAEQVLFHIHAHLTVFVNGSARRIPYGIGIPGAQASPTPAGPFVGAGSCFYWLHTHAADGIIHVESPVDRAFTLGDFFDVWGEKLGPAEVGAARGPVTAFYDGRPFRANPREIPLTRHAQIQLDVGRPLVAPAAISFPPGL